MNRPLRLFLSYSHKDERHCEELVKHLSLLERQRLIEHWHDRKITPGDEWATQVNRHLDDADIILMLISSDFLASDYCHDVELKRALDRHEANEARVIPILVRPADWKSSPLGKLHPLPKNATPISKWTDQDDAWLDVAQGIRNIVEERARRHDLAEDNRELRSELERERKQSGDLRERCESLQRTIAEMEEGARSSRATREAEEGKARLLAELRGLHEKVTSLTKELGTAYRDLRAREDDIQTLKQERDEHRRQLKTTRDELKEAQDLKSLALKRMVCPEILSGGPVAELQDERLLSWHFCVENCGEGPIRMLRVITNWRFTSQFRAQLKELRPSLWIPEELLDENHTALFDGEPTLKPGELSDVYVVSMDTTAPRIGYLLQQCDLRVQNNTASEWSQILRPVLQVVCEGVTVKHRESVERLLDAQDKVSSRKNPA